MKYRKIIAAALCGMLIFGLPKPARAEPISTAIGLTALIQGIGISAATAGAIGGALVGGAISVGAQLVSRFWSQQPAGASNTTSATGTQANVQYGAAVPRDRIFGTCATAGQLIYWNLSGPNNLQLDMVFAVGDGPHDSLAGMYVNGNAVTFGGLESPGTVVNEFTRAADGVTTMWVKFFQGFEGQAADAHLIATSNPAGRWTSNSQLSGIAYVRVTMNYEPDIYSSGLPSFLFVIKGALLYDPRLDGTNGGVGAHRWSDKTTWTWSDNPAIGLYNHQRGLWLNNELIVGEGLAPQDLIVGMYVAAANDCDGAVALAAGGTEKRYRVNMNVGADKTNSESIQAFLDAMAGQLLESAGSFGPVAGVTQAIVLPTLYDTDLIRGQPVTFAKKRSRANLINAVFGSYTDATQQYTTIPFPPRTSTADEAEDGERLSTQIDYPQIQSQTQAQRCGEITRRLSRSQAIATITVGFKFAVAEPGDWLTWASVRYGSLTWRIDGTTINADETVTLALREISSSVFAWNNGLDELSPTSPGDLPGYGALATTVSSFALVATQINGANGLTIPALRCTWTPITDQSIVSVDIQYRIQGDTVVKQVSFAVPAPATGEGLISEAIQAGTIYEARATIETVPNRAATWTSWIAQTAPALQVVQTANEALLVQFAALSADIKEKVTTAIDQVYDLARRIDSLASTLAINDLARNWLDKSILRRELSSVTGAASAKFTEQITVATGATDAVADRVTLLETAINDPTTGLSITASNAEDAFSAVHADITGNLALSGRISTLKAAIEDPGTGLSVTSGAVQTLQSQVALNPLFPSAMSVSISDLKAAVNDPHAGNIALANTTSTLVAQVALDPAHPSAISAQLTSFSTTIGDHTTSIQQLTGSIDGVSTTWSITAKIDGATGGIAFLGAKTASGATFNFVVDGSIVINGSLTSLKIGAGEVKAINMAAKSITADNGAIDNLAVLSLNIGDNAVMVPNFQRQTTVINGNGGFRNALIFNLLVDSTGLNGKKIPVFASCFIKPNWPSGTTNAVAFALIINNTVVQTWSTDGSNTIPFGMLSAAQDVFGNGGMMTVPVVVQFNAPLAQITCSDGALFAVACKR